jgi:succinate dehydrogenase/fumarate reductase flavoprotein subunit
MKEVSGGQFWDDMVRIGSWKPEVTKDAVAGYIKDGTGFQANSLDELAGLIGVDKTNFLNTVDNYNKMAKAGEDTEYHKRKELLTTIEKGPFYALKFGPAMLCMPGGLEINDQYQVLDDNREAIPGLYAIGNVSGGRYGVDYPVVMNGNSHGSALTEGYLVAEKILG